jgi:hypothetical protein
MLPDKKVRDAPIGRRSVRESINVERYYQEKKGLQYGP